MSGNRKKKRTPKRSQGINGARRHHLSAIEKVLMGKGLFRSFKSIGSGGR